MINLVIVGCGGFAIEVVQYVKDNNNKIGFDELIIKGFLDIDDDNFVKYRLPGVFLGHERDYIPDRDDHFVIANGNINIRNEIIDTLTLKEVKFINLIHHTARISDYACIGKGNIICPFSIVGPRSMIGDHNLINYHCAVAHDADIGSYNVFSPNVQITGFVKIGDSNFFGTSVTVIPSVAIGSHNVIQAGTVLFDNVEKARLVFASTQNRIGRNMLYNLK